MPMNAKHNLTVAVMAGMLSWSMPGWADEAGDLLARMREAVHTLNYSGTLVYSQGNELANYQISHKLENGTEQESVVQLAQGSGAVSENVESFSLAKFQQVQPQMEAVYRLDLGGQEVVANHSCQIVVARPRDRMRYLQRYCIDPVSGMLLKYSSLDGAHQAVEQLMFTTLEITPPADAAGRQAKVASPAAAPAAPAAASTDWTFSSLPAGFQPVQDLQQEAIDGQPAVRQIILSDGMTSVSVFITPPGAPGILDSLAVSAGATNIYATDTAGYGVVLVGEVPVATLKRISEGLQHAR